MERKYKLVFAAGLLLLPLVCNISNPRDTCQLKSTLMPTSQDCDYFCEEENLTTIIRAACEDSYAYYDENVLEIALGIELDYNEVLLFNGVTCAVSKGTFLTYSPWLLENLLEVDPYTNLCKMTTEVPDEELEEFAESTPTEQEMWDFIKDSMTFQCFDSNHSQYTQIKNLIDSIEPDSNSVCDSEVPCQKKLWTFIGAENCVGLCERSVSECDLNEDCYFNFYLQRLIDPDTNECLSVTELTNIPDPFCETLRKCTEAEFEIYE